MQRRRTLRLGRPVFSRPSGMNGLDAAAKMMNVTSVRMLCFGLHRVESEGHLATI